MFLIIGGIMRAAGQPADRQLIGRFSLNSRNPEHSFLLSSVEDRPLFWGIPLSADSGLAVGNLS